MGGGPVDDRSDSLALGALEARLAALGSACVAVSGGVDSSLVLAAAARGLGPGRVVAVTAVSATYLAEELAATRRLAAELGVEHVVLDTDELRDPAFVENSRDRCYHCKAHLLDAMGAVARERGCAALVDGANADDLSDHRPGMRAAAERGVVHPLLEAGIGKAQVRRLSRLLGLATWDAPQQACLASRIPYGEPIDEEKLRHIAGAEAVLRELGFRQCRVRYHGAVARVEVEAEEIGRAAGPARSEIARRLRALGFTYVALDLDGFRSGSMNEAPQPGSSS
jgi:pyridinium-3,5-biscarboxylic acid mononucleotide sulfurtransferase